MKKYFLVSLFFFVTLSVNVVLAEFVAIHLNGQLGNQMFQMATAIAYSKKHKIPFIGVSPETKRYEHFTKIRENFATVFEKIPFSFTPPLPKNLLYEEKALHYLPIPYRKKIILKGYFESEKYFSDYKKEVIELFSPSMEKIQKISTKYKKQLDHPCSVAVHFRDFERETHIKPNCDLGYYQEAFSHFPKTALFIVFSDNIPYCKQLFSTIERNFFFVEGNERSQDLTFMSLCSHSIISNSTLSWWGAYLNRNPTQIVIAPKQIFTMGYAKNPDYYPKEWVLLKNRLKPNDQENRKIQHSTKPLKK